MSQTSINAVNKVSGTSIMASFDLQETISICKSAKDLVGSSEDHDTTQTISDLYKAIQICLISAEVSL